MSETVFESNRTIHKRKYQQPKYIIYNSIFLMLASISIVHNVVKEGYSINEIVSIIISIMGIFLLITNFILINQGKILITKKIMSLFLAFYMILSVILDSFYNITIIAVFIFAMVILFSIDDKKIRVIRLLLIYTFIGICIYQLNIPSLYTKILSNYDVFDYIAFSLTVILIGIEYFTEYYYFVELTPLRIVIGPRKDDYYDDEDYEDYE